MGGGCNSRNDFGRRRGGAGGCGGGLNGAVGRGNKDKRSHNSCGVQSIHHAGSHTLAQQCQASWWRSHPSPSPSPSPIPHPPTLTNCPLEPLGDICPARGRLTERLQSPPKKGFRSHRKAVKYLKPWNFSLHFFHVSHVFHCRRVQTKKGSHFLSHDELESQENLRCTINPTLGINYVGGIFRGFRTDDDIISISARVTMFPGSIRPISHTMQTSQNVHFFFLKQCLIWNCSNGKIVGSWD